MPGGHVLGLRGEATGRSDVYFTPFNTDYAKAPSYVLTNARISYGPQDGGWEVAVFGRNLGDKDIPEGITVSGITASTLVTYAAPRTFGASLRLKF
jgi:iron complex outermembrane receptor protein